MADLSTALFTLREPLVDGLARDERVNELLATRTSICTVSFLSNPPLASARIDTWPTPELLSQLLREPHTRNVVVGDHAYFQLAFRADAAPAEVPPNVQFLGFDVTDGTDSYLVDYGPAPPPVGVPAERLNSVGLLPTLEEARRLSDTIRAEWGLEGESVPQVWIVYRIDHR